MAKYLKRMFVLLVFFILVLQSATSFAAYVNPLRGSIGVHDPVMIKQGNTYYVFGTGRYVPMKTSTDGINWVDAGTVFNAPVTWVSQYVPGNTGDFWAPDISYHDGLYWLYYCASSFGQNTSCIGVATNPTLNRNDPNYKWTDRGLVIRSVNSNDYNCIDPNSFTDTNGDCYLTFGSFWSGIKQVKLDRTTGKPAVANPPIVSVASRGAIEAPFLIKWNGNYYMFVSFDMCCKGVNSTYKIAVGRSNSPTGPFVDRSGKNMMQGGGNILDAGDERWKGPGHNGICFDEDKVLLINHAYDAQNNGAPIMMIRQLYLDAQGWPTLDKNQAVSAPPVYTSTPTRTPTPTQKPATSIPTNISAVEDINGDMVINIADVMLIAAHFNTATQNGNFDWKCDLNKDGAINISDVMMVASKFNTIVGTSSPIPTKSPTPTAKPSTGPTQTVTLPPAANLVESLEAYGLPGYFVRHANFEARIEPNPNPIDDSRFIERPGLADPTYVSFESVNYPGYFLRHYNNILYLQASDDTDIFKKDASFKKVAGLADPNYSSFQAYNFPDMYIRHINNVLQITQISTNLDKSDATFKVATITTTSPTTSPTPGSTTKTYYNPRTLNQEKPDPFVYKHTDGYYYGLHTIQNGPNLNKLIMYKSTSLINLFTTGTSKIIWSAPATGWNSFNVWAPELYRFDNVWYIYYSAGFRVGVLSNTSEDPTTGTWVDRGRISPNEWAIDGTILQQNGNMYLIYSGQSNAGQSMYIVKMSSPTTITGNPVLISQPTLSWERQGGLNVNEGPNIVQRNGKTMCIYSASHCASQYYCLGLLTCQSTADPMVRDNWVKTGTPIFQSANGLYGVGHHCLTKSKDGTEDWLVYHGCITASPNSYQPRYVCMQKVSFNSDGTPNFGVAAGRSSPLQYPSGEQ